MLDQGQFDYLNLSLTTKQITDELLFPLICECFWLFIACLPRPQKMVKMVGFEEIKNSSQTLLDQSVSLNLKVIYFLKW